MLSMEIYRERIYFCYICIWSCSVFFREKNPLLVDLQPEMTPSARANMWFEKVRESEIYVRTGQEFNIRIKNNLSPNSSKLIERFSNNCRKIPS